MQRHIVFIMTTCFLLASCTPRIQQLAVAGINDAMDTNDKMVASLTTLQARIRAQRKAIMVLAAKTVAQTGASREEGLRRLDAIEQSYAPVFAEFQRAEVVQNALASGLDQALVAAHNGTQQNMGSLLKLYTELHSMYNALADTIGTAGGDP